jgi:hypothetical protein
MLMRTSVLCGGLVVLFCAGARARAQGRSAASETAQASTPATTADAAGSSHTGNAAATIGGVVGLAQARAQADATARTDLAARRKALNDLIAERWEYTLRISPLFASFLGDKRWNDKLDDFSQAAIDDQLLQDKKYLARFEAIDTTGFPEQEALNKTLMVRDLQLANEGARFKPWEMAVNQNGGPHIDLPQLVSVLSFQTVKDYEDYISRMKQMPRYFDENVIQMRKGMAEGLIPPRILLEEVVGQANGIAVKSAEDSPFAQPFSKFPDSISSAEQKRLREGRIGSDPRSGAARLCEIHEIRAGGICAERTAGTRRVGSAGRSSNVCVRRESDHDHGIDAGRNTRDWTGAGERP